LLSCSSVFASHQSDGEKAPDFELVDLQGATHRLLQYRGKVVLLNFWASWCAECLIEMPSLDSLYRKYRSNNLVVLGISIDRKRETIEGVLKKVPVSYPVLIDLKGEVSSKKYTVIAIPSTYLIDQNGFIKERLMGGYDFTSPSVIEKIDTLLKGK
jgi:peroxiredoxin